MSMWDGGRPGRWLTSRLERSQARPLSRFDVIALRVIWIVGPVILIVALLADHWGFALAVLIGYLFAGFGTARHQWGQVLGRCR